MSLRTASEMQKAFKLPMLPGTTCGEELLRRNFRKTQALSGTGEASLKVAAVPMDFDSTNVVSSPKMGSTVGTASASMSATHTLDQRVLRFYGYFMEDVAESALERTRVRKVTICYFLEDGTLSVAEPKQDNSGITTGGSMVKRHQVPLQTGGMVSYQDLSVGASVTFYGRTYHIVDCDNFTREFMKAMGLEQAPAFPVPVDNYTSGRKKPGKAHAVESVSTTMNAQGMKVKLSPAEVSATKQFLEKDRQVLRCHAVWDDSKALYGEVRKFTLYYFLADDAIEVTEKDEANSGRDPFPSFCRRQKIRKPGFMPPGGVNFGAKDSFVPGSYYTDADIRIGATLTIAGRNFLVYDYDEFTRKLFREKFGLMEYNPIEKYTKKTEKVVVKREPPPYNGFGSEEDSLSSWRSLDLRPPRKVDSMYTKHGDAQIKFSLRLDNGIANDENRRFVLTCFLADKTIAIFEPPQRNSGIVGGKFLQKTSVRNPDSGKPFEASDFYIGQKVSINKYPFIVLATDERSMSFMEHNSSEFAHSNINAVVHKIQAMLISKRTGLFGALSGLPGTVNHEELAGVFARLGLPVSEQGILTVLRYFDRNGEYRLTYPELLQRLLSDDTPESDARDWAEVHAAMTNAATEGLSVADKVDTVHRAVENTTAAYAARAFLQAYQARRHRFHTEFKFATDYAVDNKIGEKEFRVVVTDKLDLGLTQPQIDALVTKTFPPGARRVTYEEFLRIINGSSNFEHNLEQTMKRR